MLPLPFCTLLVTLLVAPLLLAQPTPLAPMAKDAHPSFAVVTIKPHDPNYPRRQSWGFAGSRVSIQNQTLASMMMYAYSINPRQLAGVPEWAEKAAFDVEGVTDTPGQPNLQQQQEILQKLLADRFELRFHREQRTLNVYAIQTAKGGPKLTPAAHLEAEPTQRGTQQGAALCNKMGNVGMVNFVQMMQFMIPDRPLVDQTGLVAAMTLICATHLTNSRTPTPMRRQAYLRPFRINLA